MESSQLEERARSRVGTVLRGKYRIDRVLGVGGMAVVYRATHRNQAEFAVKMLHPELSLNEDICRRFLREGYLANSVKHPGAVAVVDDDVAEDGAAFIVMELLDGVSVEDLWSQRGGRLPVDVTCAVALELLDVLVAAHAKGIVHRDIKPANVFITRAGVLKVLDFGIARVHDGMAGDSQATAAGSLLGTPAFMAPEQALGKTHEIDAKVDLWAVGATIFTLLSGATLHEADNGAQLLVKLATEPPRSLASVAPETPAAIVSVVDRAYAFDRAARWPSAAAMRDALAAAYRASLGETCDPRAILGGLFVPQNARADLAFVATAVSPSAARSGTQTPQPVAAKAEPSLPPRKRHVVAALAATVAIALIGGGTLWMRDHGEARAIGASGAAAEPPVVNREPAAGALVSPTSPPSAGPSAPTSPTAESASTAPSASDTARTSRLGDHEPRRTAAPARPSGVASGGQLRPAAPTAASAPAPRSTPVNCDPPYIFDPAGNRVFKKECL